MNFHIILTEKCNSECRYCYKKSEKEFGNKLNKKFEFDFSAPCNSNLDVKRLKKFLEKDKDTKIIFYGGEPLLNIPKMEEVMDSLPNVKYFMQTNGKLLDKLPPKYINKFSKILISIDGDKERTDFNRGEGTYELIIKNMKRIRENGFKGEIVARMTVSFSDGFADLLKQIKHLLGIGFDSIHWQLDMGFYEFDYDKNKVSSFIQEYNKEVLKLIEFWAEQMKSGKVLKIYPLLGITESLLKNEKTRLRCGSGYANYTITTDGKIVTCPIMNCIKDFCVGDIDKNSPNKLKEISVTEPCISCSYSDSCGGRCLYSNYAKLWPKEGEEQICRTIKLLIDSLKKKIPEINSLINKKIISLKDFEYEKYFGPEIIP